MIGSVSDTYFPLLIHSSNPCVKIKRNCGGKAIGAKLGVRRGQGKKRLRAGEGHDMQVVGFLISHYSAAVTRDSSAHTKIR